MVSETPLPSPAEGDDATDPSPKRRRRDDNDIIEYDGVHGDDGDIESAQGQLLPYVPGGRDADADVVADAAAASLLDDDGVLRTSSLASPTMKLSGHKGSVYCLAYDPQGEYLCSGSFDSTCLLWNAGGTCENVNILKGHKNAILDLKFSNDSERVVTAGADHNLGYFDATTGERIKRFLGHEGIVNAVDVIREGSAPLAVSAGDDRTIRLWDARVRGHVGLLEDSYQVTAVAYSIDGNEVYAGGIDNCITAWDVRKMRRSMKMKGHTDTITCISLNPKGTHVLSNSMDGSLRTWDVRPFATGDCTRHEKTFVGATHNAERGLLHCSWSADGSSVAAGSADGIVRVWDELSAEELYYLPGHNGTVNSVVFHPKENVVASASSDKTIFVGELAQS